MGTSLQLVATLAIVAVAAGYLAARARAILIKKRAGGCGSCTACPAGAARPADALDVVAIGGLAPAPIEGHEGPREDPHRR